MIVMSAKSETNLSGVIVASFSQCITSLFSFNGTPELHLIRYVCDVIYARYIAGMT